MRSDLLGERSDVLPGKPASVGRARRLVADALAAWALDALVDDASLLVSEVVTNAVLHAGTDVTIRIRRAGGGVRVEVADGSPVAPAPRRYHGEAVTGRGLQILGSTASAWGTTITGSGKVVWFDLGRPPGGSSPGAASAAGGPEECITVHWEGLPPRLTKTTLEHGDAMLRELALLSFDESTEHASIAPIVTPALDLGDLLTALDEAMDTAVAVTAVSVRIPAASAEGALDRLALVDEADRMADDGELLIPAALPEIVDCRHWLLGEIVAQAAGRAPTPWRLAPASLPEHEWQPLSQAEIRILGDELPQSVVADQENRIVFIGEDAANLLGWAPADLLGRRLTDIVPPDLREAHLVGFTRCQLTGAASLSGTPLALRARHADGTDIDVAVVLDTLPRRDGRFRHRGRLEAR